MLVAVAFPLIFKFIFYFHINISLILGVLQLYILYYILNAF